MLFTLLLFLALPSASNEFRAIITSHRFVNSQKMPITIKIDEEIIFADLLEKFPKALIIDLSRFQSEQPLLEVTFLCLKERLPLTKFELSCILLDFSSNEAESLPASSVQLITSQDQGECWGYE
jgi:hypothetical protein